MQRKVITTLMIVIVAMAIAVWLGIVLEIGNARIARASNSFLPAVTATSQSPGSPISGIDWTNPAIIAAFIALVGVLITAGASLYLFRRTRQLEQEKIRLQDQVAAARTAKVQEQEHQAIEASAAQAAMLRAKTTAERVDAYRKALRADPRIARLQILDMNRPLEVTDIYIRLRLHQETRPNFELDPALQDAQTRHDPNALLKASQLHLEHRASAALPPEEALHTHQHCVIVGDPGAGKTTLLKYLALQSVNQQLTDLPDLPIHIELNAFTISGYGNLLEFASSVWEERYGFPKAEALNYMQAKLREGRALLLLDALDETVAGTTKEQAEESYLQASKAITDVATRYHQAPIVVTARKAGYHQRTRLAGFTELEVLDFRPEEIKQFVERWFACHPDSHKRGNAPELNAKLERNPRIQALAANPLLLSLIVIVYEDQLDLPERRAELYKQCVDILLTKWDASRNIRRLRAFKPEHKRQLLEEVAWYFHLRGERYFPESDLLNVIAAFLPAVGLQPEQNGQVLDEITAENGLLKEQARGWQGFLHLTLQEYFAALYAVDHQQLDSLMTRRDDPWWEEVLLLYAGRIPDASPLLQHLLGLAPTKKIRDDLFHTNLILAGRCLAAYPTVRQASLREEVISRLSQVLRSSPYSLTKEQVAEALAEIGGATVNAHLIQLFDDERLDVHVGEAIAKALGELGERSVAPQLVQLLTDNSLDREVRGNIAYALGELGERSVVPQLVKLLTDNSLDESICPQLVKLLTDNSLDESICLSITHVLSELGERSVVPQLVQLLTDNSLNGEVGQAIARALGKLSERSVAPQLVQLLTDNSLGGNARGNIAYALGELGERSVVPQLVQLLTNNSLDGRICQGIAEVLGELGERALAPQLVQLLTNNSLDGNVRGNIAYVLGELGERSVVPQLVQLLTDNSLDIQTNAWFRSHNRGYAGYDLTVREAIAYALGKLGERSVAPQLVQLLTDNSLDENVRASIAHALISIGDLSILHDLVRIIGDERVNKALRSLLVYDLGELGERSVAPQLVQLLTNNSLDWEVGQTIAYALDELGERSVVPQLVKLLEGTQLDLFISKRIADALTQLVNDEETVHTLAAILLTSNIADSIHRMLWTLCHKVGVRIFVTDGPAGKQLEVVKQPSA